MSSLSRVEQKEAISNFLTKEEYPYNHLLQQRAAGKIVPEKQLEQEKDNLLKRGLSHRFIYEVKKSNRVKAYLMGLYHSVNEVIATDKVFHETLKKCGFLLVERAGNHGIEQHPSGIKAVPYTKSSDPGLDYDFDSSLARSAAVDNIETRGLESNEDHLRWEEELDLPNRLDKDFLEKYGWFREATREERIFAVFELYLGGNPRFLYDIAKGKGEAFFEKMILKRNREWMSKFIPYLENLLREQKPACLAVGLSHLLGTSKEDGIIPMLRRHGFEVNRIKA